MSHDDSYRASMDNSLWLPQASRDRMPKGSLYLLRFKTNVCEGRGSGRVILLGGGLISDMRDKI